MNLRDRLAARIAREGPISIADYMNASLHDPSAGYYATRPRLGEGGDFLTAPHVSQMFGEVLGLWAAEVWIGLGRPSRARLVELGPGDGTLLRDALGAAKVVPGFLASVEAWAVETSEPLQALQRQALAGAGVRWTRSLASVPTDAPLVILANEFLDCLPIRQAVWTGAAWRERKIGVDGAGGLAFEAGERLALPPVHGESASTDLARRLAPPPSRGERAAIHLPRGQARGRMSRSVPPSRSGGGGAARSCAVTEGAQGDGHVFEWSDALTDFGRTVGGLIARAGGAALFIDYGRDAPGLGDTLQALRGHAKEDPLASPGLADLTAHVDFPAFLAAARGAGGATTAIRPQGDFLRALGLETRAAVLAAAHPGEASKIARQVRRLAARHQMGALFKAACVHARGPPPPGFGPP